LFILVVASIALYSTFSSARCIDLSCFQAHLSKCRSATFINDAQKEAAWEYNILGTHDKKCEVEVRLLIAKDSSLDLRQYEGETMVCSHPIGAVGYPEKNLAACRGDLKEDLQSIVIEKMYKYLVANIGDVKKEISSY